MKIVIQGGRAYDPCQDWNGERRNLALADGRLVAPEEVPEPDLRIDAKNLVVTAAALDPAAHVAPFEVLQLRQAFEFPTPEQIGQIYAERGYGHVHQPFLTPQTALSTYQQLADLHPWVDSSVSLALPIYELEPFIESGAIDQAAESVEQLANTLGAWGLYLVQPDLRYRFEVYQHKNRGPEAVLDFIARLSDQLNSRLSLPAEALTPEALHSLPPGLHLQRLARLLTPAMIDRLSVLDSRGIYYDWGLPWHEPTLSHTWREPREVEQILRCDLGFYPNSNWKHHQGSDFRLNVELMNHFKSTHNPLGTLSTEAANLALLNDWESFLQAVLESWSVRQFIQATRSRPAEILNLPQHGHLRNGAQAHIALFPAPAEDHPSAWAKSFSRCHTLIREGRVVMEDGQITASDVGISCRKPEAASFDLSFLEEGMSLRPQTIARMGAARCSEALP